MSALKLIVGGSLEDDAKGFLDAWHHTERGEDVSERAIEKLPRFFEERRGLRLHRSMPSARISYMSGMLASL